MNFKADYTIDPSTGNVQARGTFTTPLLGGRVSGNIFAGALNMDLMGPQLNLPLGVGVNAFVRFQWN
jgi:hypothetical protein